MLADLIVQMQNELRTHSNGYVQRFEDVLGQVAALNNPDCIGPLLPFFDDDAEYDEMMFSIIHTIEKFDDSTYVRAITNHLDSFLAKSPRWAVIVHMRILNSPPTMAAYADRIKSLSNEQRQVVRKVLEAVRQKNAKFETPCKSLLAAL